VKTATPTSMKAEATYARQWRSTNSPINLDNVMQLPHADSEKARTKTQRAEAR
jgi:hypothetical protein